MARLVLVASFCFLSACALSAKALADDEKDEPVFRGKKSAEWLAILRGDKQPTRRRAALIALNAFGPKAKFVIPAVSETLRKDESEEVRTAAAQLLGNFIPPALAEKADIRSGLEALTVALRVDKADRVREASAASLGKIGVEARAAVPSLAAALKDKHAGTSAAAAESLAAMAEVARSAAPALIETLKDKDADRFARGFAAIALIRIGGSESGLATPALTEAVADAKAPTALRETSVRLLGQLGKDAQPAVPTLARALKDKSVEIRRAAAGALAELGPLSKEALPDLEAAVKDKDKNVRCSAIYALGSFGKDAAKTVPMLAGCVRENIVEIRLAAIRSLGNIGVDSKEAKNALLDAARESQTDIREAATDALKKLQTPKAGAEKK